MKTRRMMTLVGLAIAVSLLSASGAYAQEQHFNPEIGNGQWSAVEPPVSTTQAELGYFNPEVGNVPQPDPVTLRGKGEEVAMTSGEFIQETQIVEDDYAPEGQSVYLVVTRTLPVQTLAQEVTLRGK